jgi:hypothetical protein
MTNELEKTIANVQLEHKRGIEYVQYFGDEKILEQYMANTHLANPKDVEAILMLKFPSFRHFLMASFDWAGTIQGSEYWLKLLLHIEEKIKNIN